MGLLVPNVSAKSKDPRGVGWEGKKLPEHAASQGASKGEREGAAESGMEQGRGGLRPRVMP